MAISDFARAVEKRINSAGISYTERAGWHPSLAGYYGYGDVDKVRVFARVMMKAPDRENILPHRGFRQFFTIQVGDHPVTIQAGNATVNTHTNSGGYVDFPVKNHGLEPGWQTVRIEAEGAEPVDAEVLILEPGTRFGVVSDIDDTILVTMLPRAVTAAYNSWFVRTNARKPVPGMTEFYETILDEHPEIPFFYLSTGAWNTFHSLVNFIAKHALPKGPMLLTDWGPSQTSMFRSGQEHKRVQLRNLVIDFPDITWILVGDDGQHDPFIYGNFAEEHPDRVAALAIRQLSPSEHVLAHGTAAPLSEVLHRGMVPTIAGADGFDLRKQWVTMDEIRPGVLPHAFSSDANLSS